MTIEIEHVTWSAFIDTVATVSTISSDFYNKYLSHIEIHSLDDVLHIECAVGQHMSYAGYISASIKPYGTPQAALLDNFKLLIFIFPNSNYNARVTMLIGTNIINRLLQITYDDYGSKYLQEADLDTTWYLAFCCLSLRQSNLQRNNNRLCLIKSAATKRLVIPPNERVVVEGCMDKNLPYHRVLAMLQATRRSTIHTDVDITPSLHFYNF